MVFGAKPTRGVALETKMVANLLDHLMLKQDPVRKTISFPRDLDQLKTDDASFELSVSNSIEKLTLYHRSSTYMYSYKNVVGKSIGVVFVNSASLNREYNSD